MSDLQKVKEEQKVRQPKVKDDQKSTENKKLKSAAIKDLIDSEEYIIRKRLPRKLPKRDCDVYVSRKTNFSQQLNRCQRILDNENVVYIHGLGIAINRAINLALQLKDQGMGTVEISVHTSTVELVDDAEPLTDEKDAEVFSRNNSAVHIKVFRPDAPITMSQTAALD